MPELLSSAPATKPLVEAKNNARCVMIWRGRFGSRTTPNFYRPNA